MKTLSMPVIARSETNGQSSLYKRLSQLLTIFGMVMVFAVSGWSDSGSNDDCSNIESITALNNKGTTTATTVSGTVSTTSDQNDYYYFTAGASGTVTFNYSSTNTTKLYISTVKCGNYEKSTDADITAFPNTTFSVNAGEIVSIRINARNKKPSYTLNLTYTVPATPPGIKHINDQVILKTNAMASIDLDNYVIVTNGDSVTYSVSGLPAGVTYNSTSHIISGTPTALGLSTITVKASDKDGTTQTNFFLEVVTNTAIYNNNNHRNFTLQRQDNLYGDMQIIGNSIMLDKSTTDGCAPNGTPNNSISTKFADKDSNSETYNSTSANLKLPAGVDSSRIKYAYLYWQGRTHDKTKIPLGKRMKLKFGDTGGYTTVESNVSKFNWSASGYADYQGSADVTAQLKNSIDSLGSASGYDQPVWGADIYAQISTGRNDFGAWSLVVVYAENTTIDPTVKFRSVTLYDGYLDIHTGDKSFPLSGFLTPKTGAVDAKFLMFGGEGDIAYEEGLTLTNASGTAVSLADAPGTPASLDGPSVWGSSEDIDGVNVTNRNPSCQNTIGVDIRTFSIGTANTTKIIDNNQTSTTVTLKGPADDQYFPGVFAFSTELYMPKLCYDYSLKQDGAFLDINRSTSAASIKSFISASPIELAIYLRNKEADILAQQISLKADLNPATFGYDMTKKMYVSNPNGTVLIDREIPYSDTTTQCPYSFTSGNAIGDKGCVANGANLRVRKGDGNLGSEEYIYTKFILKPNAAGYVDESLGLTIDYYITAGGAVVPYTDYALGSATVPMCTQTSDYNPLWGQFNVVQHKDKVVGNIENNLKTRVSRDVFNVDVIFDSNTSTGTHEAPLANVNTTVQVEMFDADSFGDMNASCAYPDNNLSAPIFVPIAFTPASYKTLITQQDKKYHDFAVKNGAFRIWYFTDKNSTLRPWNAVGLSNANKSITAISGSLFDSASHGDCNTSCGVGGGSPTDLPCFECMKKSYGKPLCSRDNFSVRPESFDIRIKDYSADGTVTTDLTHDVYKYAPDTTPALNGRINLAAGYNYKYDINATGHEKDANALVRVPGYTRHYSLDSDKKNHDYNATIIWDTSTPVNCNDTNSTAMTFYMGDGAVDQNASQNLILQNQVGEYRLNMIDKTWTAVDQIYTNSNSYRTTANNFIGETDCNLTLNITYDSSYSDANEKMQGCEISTAHLNSPLVYKDQNITFKPAKFDLSSFQYGLGLDNNISAIYSKVMSGVNQRVGFVYMSDLSNVKDMNMSVRATGQIRAQGENSITLTNFVSGCFASDLDLLISNNANLAYTTPFTGRMITRNIADTNDTSDTNKTNMNTWTGTITRNAFIKDDNGTLMSAIRLNFDRNQTTTHNPQIVQYKDINITCHALNDCNTSSMRNQFVINKKDATGADQNLTILTPNTAKGASAMDFNITHVYGKVIPPNNIHLLGLQAFSANAEYAEFNTSTLLDVPMAVTTIPGNGTDWFKNTLHNESTYGEANVTIINPSSGSSLPSTSYENNGTVSYSFSPFTIYQNYRAHIDTEGWLWHGIAAKTYNDPSAANMDCLTHPCFNILVGRIIGNTGSAKTESESEKQNKNSTTGGGWHSTSEYAPSTR